MTKYVRINSAIILILSILTQATVSLGQPRGTPKIDPIPLGDDKVPSMFFGTLSPEEALNFSRQLQELRSVDPDATVEISQDSSELASSPNPEEQNYSISLADGSVYSGPITSTLLQYLYGNQKIPDRGGLKKSLRPPKVKDGGITPLLIFNDNLVPTVCASETCINPTYGTGNTSQKGDLSVLGHAGYDYAPTIMYDEGKYKMWWCSDGHIFGDRIFYAESTTAPWLENGSWTLLNNGVGGIVFQPKFDGISFDSELTCDPSVVKVGGIYFMYYSAYPAANSSWSTTTRIGAAYSYDGKVWTRYNGGVAPIINVHTPNYTGYGVSHPSVIFVDGFFYMTYDDTSGADFGQYAIRSADPFFQIDVEEWRNGNWVPLNGSTPTTQYAFLETYGADWAYSPASREFIVSINGVGVVYSDETVPRGTHSSIRVFNKDLTTQTRPIVHARAQWIDSPGLVTFSSGHILQNSTCSTFWLRVLRGGRDWNDPTGAFTPAQCENNYHIALGGGNYTPQQRLDAFYYMISCSELAYEGWDMASNVSGCRSWATGQIVPDDYDDDAISEPVIWRPSSGVWWTKRSETGLLHGEQWGIAGDKPIFTADYDADRIADPAVKRNGDYYVLTSTGTCPWPFVPFVGTKGCFRSTGWSNIDVPLPGDYDGDGKTDIAARSTAGAVKVIPSSGTCPSLHFTTTTYNGVIGCLGSAGGSGDKPLVADFNGDNKTDIAFHRPNPPQIWTYLSAAGSCSTYRFAANGNACFTNMFATADVPVTGDFDNDSKTDIMWWSAADFTFRTWGASGSFCPSNFTNAGTYCHLGFGLGGDIPLAKQFNGDGKAEPTTWRPSDGYWYTNRTGGVNLAAAYWGPLYFPPNIFRTQWGLSGDKVEGLR